ncbi:MAG: hypothetical protein ABI968_15240 [Acidobacteriota bacterium]
MNTIISDYDSGVAPALQIQSDQHGTYVNSTTLTSMIFASGLAAIPDSYYIKKGATRTVCLTFSQPIPGSGPNGGNPVAPASSCYLARINLECPNFGLNPLTLPAGQTMSCPMNVHFAADGKTYDLHMAPLSVNFPGTDPVNVTCIFPTSGTNPCSQWLVQPSGTDGTWLRNVANLSYEKSVKGQTTYVKQGDFYFSFSIILMTP